MRRTRFTIGGLMGLVVVMGISFAALRSPTALWDSGLFSLALITLGTATLGAFWFRGRTRAKWAGFAAFGIVYLGMASGPWSEAIGSRLVTTAILDAIDAQIHPKKGIQTLMLTATTAVAATPTPGNPTGSISITTGGAGNLNASTIQANNFVVWNTVANPLDLNLAYLRPVGHSLWTLIVAMLGGTIGGVVFGVAERREEAAKTNQVRQIDADDFSLSDLTSKDRNTTATTGLSG